MPARWGPRSTQVFVAGNVLHPVETAGHCWAEGRRAAQTIFRDLRKTPKLGAGARIVLGAGLRYVVPQRLGAGSAATLNIRTDGAVRGRVVLSDASGRELAARSVRSYPEQPVRLPVPALDSAALAGDLTLRLGRKD